MAAWHKTINATSKCGLLQDFFLRNRWTIFISIKIYVFVTKMPSIGRLYKIYIRKELERLFSSCLFGSHKRVRQDSLSGCSDSGERLKVTCSKKPPHSREIIFKQCTVNFFPNSKAVHLNLFHISEGQWLRICISGVSEVSRKNKKGGCYHPR